MPGPRPAITLRARQALEDNENPLYLSLAKLLQTQIVEGELAPGTRLPTIEQLKESTVAQARLAEGISSLPPGRILVWELGQGFNLLQEDGPQEHTFTITADGPFGPVPPLTYIVDLADWRGQPARASGNLRQVTKAIEGLAAKISKQK